VNLLILNPGSSSIKFSVFATSEATSEPASATPADPAILLDGELSEIATPKASLSITRGQAAPQTLPVPASPTPAEAIAIILNSILTEQSLAIAAVGYRVVHPGPEIKDHTRITPTVLNKLEAATAFAPLHDPEALTIIRETMSKLPAIPHFACFDTIFHRTMPEEATTYPIPQRYRDQGVKRYGFHGLSCESVLLQMKLLGPIPNRIVIAHLGSGCSVTALLDGSSIDTTMGLTPTGGVVMGTRPGDLDPGLILYLQRQQSSRDPTTALEKILNHDAGMAALTGLPNDMQAIRSAASTGNQAATLALKIFTRSIRKAIGAYAWLLGGLDAIVFTGGIGQHDAATRAEVLSGLSGLGVNINSSLNHAPSDGVRRITASDSITAVFAVPAQEDLVIALHVERMLKADA
jgi:acetate kinase